MKPSLLHNSKEVINAFTNSIEKLLDELDTKYDGLKKAKETERTRVFYTKKILRKWFFTNGGLRL